MGCTGALALVLGFFLNAFSESVPFNTFLPNRLRLETSHEQGQYAATLSGSILSILGDSGCVFFCENPKGICELRSFGSCRIKETDESTLDKDSSVSLIRHDPNDLRSQIRFRILPKKRTISLFSKCCRGFNNFTG